MTISCERDLQVWSTGALLRRRLDKALTWLHFSPGFGEGRHDMGQKACTHCQRRLFVPGLQVWGMGALLRLRLDEASGRVVLVPGEEEILETTVSVIDDMAYQLGTLIDPFTSGAAWGNGGVRPKRIRNMPTPSLQSRAAQQGCMAERLTNAIVHAVIDMASRPKTSPAGLCSPAA